ncbi:MAG: ClpX C4-type zinc finger protein [Nannocystaceae bacterium]
MAGVACSFCGSGIDEVGELYPGIDAHICPGCVGELHQQVRGAQGLRARARALRERALQEANFLRNALRYRARARPHRDHALGPIFLLCTQRTGSSLLFDYLSCIPDSSFSFEMLNHEMSEGIKRGSPRAKVLDHIRFTTFALGAPVCGAKLFLDQLRVHDLDPGDLVRLFPRAKLLLLYRNNLAEQYVSLEIARRTDAWFYYGQAPDHREPIHVDPEALLGFARDCRDKYARIVEHPVFAEQGLAVCYESIAQDFEDVMVHELADFLELPPWDFESELVKRNTRSLQQIIDNYDELEDLLHSEQVRLYIDQQE